LLFRSNGLPLPRLGLAISKKCAPRAVDRARLKRIVRESFRQHRAGLSGWDVVVMCARGAPTLSNQRLFAILEQSWAAIENQSCVES
jgi:ribonuclease P protein component